MEGVMAEGEGEEGGMEGRCLLLMVEEGMVGVAGATGGRLLLQGSTACLPHQACHMGLGSRAVMRGGRARVRVSSGSWGCWVRVTELGLARAFCEGVVFMRARCLVGVADGLIERGERGTAVG
jgi:hypothetical protein